MKQHCIVWVKYESDEPWFPLPRPARYGRELPPLTEREACKEAESLRASGLPAKALPVGVDPNAAKVAS